MHIRVISAHVTFFCFLIGVAVWMRKRLRTSPADRGAKIRHIVFVLYLLYMHWRPFFWLIGAIGINLGEGVEAVQSEFRIERMIVSGNVGLAVWLVTVSAGAAVMGLALGMARCRPWAGRAIRVLLPYIYVADSLMTYVELAARPGKRPVDTFGAFLFSQVFFAVAVGWIYVWMYVFYRSERSAPLFSVADVGDEPDG